MHYRTPRGMRNRRVSNGNGDIIFWLYVFIFPYMIYLEYVPAIIASIVIFILSLKVYYMIKTRNEKKKIR